MGQGEGAVSGEIPTDSFIISKTAFQNYQHERNSNANNNDMNISNELIKDINEFKKYPFIINVNISEKPCRIDFDHDSGTQMISNDVENMNLCCITMYQLTTLISQALYVRSIYDNVDQDIEFAFAHKINTKNNSSHEEKKQRTS